MNRRNWLGVICGAAAAWLVSKPKQEEFVLAHHWEPREPVCIDSRIEWHPRRQSWLMFCDFSGSYQYFLESKSPFPYMADGLVLGMTVDQLRTQEAEWHRA